MTTDAPAMEALAARPPRATRALSALVRPFKVALTGLDRLVMRVDLAPDGQTVGVVRLRRAVAVLIGGFAIVYLVQSGLHGRFISPVGLVMLMMPVALYVNRGGRFLRDWVPILLGIFAYSATISAVPAFGLGVHYLPQIDADRIIGMGTLPTNWLQAHLYNGHIGALEFFSAAMYISHFLAPLLLAFLLWAFWRGRGFSDLLFGILTVSILGDITFLLAPTAPPWLASEQGLIPPVHPILKDTLAHLQLNGLANLKGDAGSYNVVAAVPSLHAAWPVVCLLVIRKYRLPLWLFSAQAALTLGIVFAIVYTGEHYVIDAIIGALYAFVAWWLVQWVLESRRGPRAAPEASPS
jgi:PAP2 superfamily